MNRIFRIIWSKSLRTWVVASELATRSGKGGGSVDERDGAAASPTHRFAADGWPMRACAAALLLALYAPAGAADWYWDADGNGTGVGGAGIWNTSSLTWSGNPQPTLGPYFAWNNAAIDNAIFQGTAGTVTLGGAITAQNLTFNVHNYTLTGGSLTLAGTTPTIGGAGNAIIESNILGTAGLTKTGGGGLTLSGNNTFSGGIFLDGGELYADDDAALGAAGNTITTAGAADVTFSVDSGPVNRTVVIGDGGTVRVSNAAGQARYTGAGNVFVNPGQSLTNNTSTYSGTTRFTGCNGICTSTFTSVADLGIASALGAPTTVANGTIVFTPGGQYSDNISYAGDGDSSNRNWTLGGSTAGRFYNDGTGTLILTGDIATTGGGISFIPVTADMQLLGQISGVGASFSPSAGRTLTLGSNNSFTGGAGIGGAGTVVASVLANAGSNSSLGAGTDIGLGGTLSYIGGAATTDRNWSVVGTLNHNGTGALSLTGNVEATGLFTLGGSFGGTNTLSGVVSGAGGLRSNGAGTWVLTGANTFSGAVTVDAGTLRADNASAFGASTAFTINGGTLDLNGNSKTLTSLTGTGGTLALGSGTLTTNIASGNSTYSGAISGSGGLTKLGLGTLTLKGTNTYTGATTVNNGTLALDFTGAGGPTSNIVSSASTLNMGGGTVSITGAAGESNSQTFNGMNVLAGNNTLRGTSNAGNSVNVNFGAITYTGGIANFVLPTIGGFTTTNADGVLGGWATINGSDYAKVVGGNIVAFTASDYATKDDASTWISGDVVADTAGTANSPFFNTVNSDIQLGGLRYAANASSTVSVDADNTLAIGGTIIVAPSIVNRSLLIQGGSITGAAGGGALGVQQNGAGSTVLTIASNIVDNGGATSFVKSGTGQVTLTGDNSYTGATTISQGRLAVSDIGMGGATSGIGASTADASNLVLQGGELRYTGTGDTTDRGFTLMRNGPVADSTVSVTDATANLRFDGEVVSPDGAGLNKTGAGTLTLANGNSSYTGVTTVSGGTLSVDDLANGGENSGIGASGSASANLVLQTGGTLQYTGASVTTDRGFTLAGQFGGAVDVSDAGTTLEVGGTVVGVAGALLTKEGAGTLVLSGTNTYAAQTFVNEGTLRAGSTQAFSTNVMNLADVAGATLDLAGFDNTIGGLQGGGATGGNVLLGDATLTVGGYNASFSGSISGNGGLTKEGGGTQTLVGCNNSYDGPTTITGGTLRVDCLRDGGVNSGIGASDSDPSNLVISGGTLEYTGGNITVDRGINLTAGDGYVGVTSAGTTLGFTGLVTGAGRLRKSGSGTLVLSGANDYSGNTVIDGGTLRAGSASAFGTGGVEFNAAGTALDLANIDTSVSYLHSHGEGWGNVQLGSATLTIDPGANTFSGVIEGSGGLVKNGGGHQTLTGCNSTYDGSTTLNGGTLSVQCLSNGGLASSIGDSSAVASNLNITGGGNLRYIGDGDSTNRQFTMGGHATLESTGTGAIEYTDTAAITMTGTAARTLTLTGTNTDDNLLAAQIDNLSASVATSLTKSSTGTWVLTNENSGYTGVTDIQGGVLEVTKLSNGGEFSSIGRSTNIANNLIVRNLATLRYLGDGDSTDRLILAVNGNVFIESSGTGALRFTNTDAWTMWGNAAHVITLGGTYAGDNLLASRLADVGVHKTSIAKNGPGTWIITGNNTHTGDTVINDGNLVIGDGGNSGNLGTGNVIVAAPTSTLSINRNDIFNFASTISGQGGLAQIGTGTTRLTATNNSIGSARIDAGTLQVDGALATSTLGINGTSTLAVNGTVQAVGGTTTTLTGDAGDSTIDVNAGGTLRANGDLGDGNDTVDLAGTLDTGAAKLNLGAGDDTLALTEGAAILGAGVDAGTGTNDTLQVNHTSPLTFDAANINAFENLIKQNTGALTLTGNQSFDNGVQIQGGSLTVGDDNTDSLVTAAVTMGDGTTLNVNGTLQNAGGTTATLTGSAGANTVNVAGGATLAANGDLGDGNDTLDLSGTLNTGAGVLGLGAGDDTVTLNDGAILAGNGIDAGAETSGDLLVLNNASALSFDGSRTAGFENLVKQNAGIATMTGNQSFIAGTTVTGGALDVDGSLTTPTVDMTGGTALTIDGSLQGTGGTSAAITGDGGAQTVTVNGTATATGDLGAGNDTLDVAGTLDIGGGTFDLGDGDDNFVVHDGTVVIGTIDGGAGLDSRTYDISTTADLGTLVNFEGVTKTGTGTLNINGPGATDLQEVEVLGGTLHIDTAASVVATAGSALNTVVGGGATLNVDGSFGCGAQADTMTVSGTVSGSGTIDLCGGDDTLSINDGAVLNNTISGGAGTADTVLLNNAGAMSFDASNTPDFEVLAKDNVGVATLTGSATFTGGTQLHDGTLTIAGSLTTPTVAMASGTTLNVDGSLQGAGGTAANIAGSAGVETVNITGTATATGGLGAGNDTLDVAGTLDIGGGTFNLGDGDDNFVVHDGTVVIGTIDGGAGLDSRTYDISTTADLGTLVNFEGVTKTGTGTLNINGPGATDLQEVEVLGGTLHIDTAASVVATAGSALNTVVGGGATLNVDGSFGCGAQADTMTVSGTVSGSGTIDLCGGDDTLTLSDGAVLANTIDGGAHGAGDRVVLNNAGAMTFDGANTVNFEFLQKDNTGEATLTGVAAYTGGTLLNGGTLTVAGDLTTPTLTMADNTWLNVDGTLQGNGAAAAITGSAGANTVTVAAGATLTATGDLGGGNDVLDAAGTIDTDGGVFSLGAGDDTFNVYDTTDTALATIDGGAGVDLLDVDVGAGNTVPLGSLLGFESLDKSGLGTLEVHGASDFIEVDLNAGTLRVTDTGGITATNTTILSGATLELADGGSYSGTAGSDTFTVAGTVVSTGTNAGTIDLGAGSDTFTIQDGADLSGLAQPVSGGAGTDTFVADLAGTATLGGAVDFETLTKTSVGTLIVAGPAMSTFSTVNVLGGTLDIGAAGSLTGVQNATVANGATLNVDGVFGFTAGADSFTVAGTVTGASTIDMLDGDDTFVVQDGANLSGLNGPVDGGAGTDTFVADLAGTATLGGAVNFETLNKTNVGTLVVAGPASSSFSTVNVLGGMLDIGVNGSLNDVAAGTVANGATLNVDGIYTGSAGNDTLTVAGTVTGSGNIALGDGDDTLTLNDGADLSGLAGALDGGAHGGGDRVVLNNAGAMTFDAGNVVNFEFLQKDNTGEATLTGTTFFDHGTDLNGGMLTVAGNLTTPIVSMGEDTTLNVDGAVDANLIDMADDTALNVDGTLQNGSGASTAIIGSDGVNTITITGSTVATGLLGAGNDVLDVAGTLNTNGGTFALGDGDDDFVVHDGTTVTGTIDGGAGLDSRVYDIAGNAEFGALLNFEGVTKRGAGTLNISGPGATDLQSVEVEGGTLNVGAAGSVVATAGSALNTVVASGATLNVDGSFGCGDGADTMTVAGTVSGSGTVAMCAGDDTLTLQDGATLANIIDGGADTDTVVLDTATAMSFDAAQTVNFETLQKDNVGEATLTGTSAFAGGTLLNGGTLTVVGELITPTVALADGTTLDVDGSLHGDGSAAALTGSAGVNTVNVTGDLFATGDLGGGGDVLDVSGSLNTGGGTFALGDGDDTLTIHDGTEIIGTVAAGAGNDTFNTDIATNADLGAVQGFETLSKTGAGTLNINGPMSSDFSTVDILAGTVNVASNGSVMAQSTRVAAGSTLQISGSYSGTAGDDSFTSMGTVRGALAFGAGADTARFVGGDVSGLTGLDGGAGSSDLLSFSGLDLADGNVSTLAGWERMELLNGSALTLGTVFNLGGVLAIDATSQLFANAGAGISGSVENAGLINVGANRLAIGGGYTGNDGALQLTVSPGTSSAGGLDIAGDVVGTTRVVFGSDGSSPVAGSGSIQVIASPNDNTGTAGGFVPDGSADGLVRLEGSPYPWTFEQQADRNWYLSSEATTVLPEINGYSVVDGLGTLSTYQALDMGHDRLGGVRGGERPQCDDGRAERSSERAGTGLVDDCHGVWVAATASELELGADPGVEATGDDVGLYVGIDGTQERGNKTLRGGAYLGYLHGVYWTTGANSGDLAMDPARIDMDAPVAGLYGSSQWNNGTYIDLVLSGQRLRANVSTSDGFTDHLSGETLALSARFGRSYRLHNGWTLEPQVQLSASQVKWDDHVDAGGRELLFDDDLVGKARAALRVEKAFATRGGAQVRPWATLGVQNVIGENDNGVRVSQPGSASGAISLPNHDLGTSASLDVGLDMTVDKHVSFFGAISIDQDLSGSHFEQRGANIGMRVRW